MRLVVPVTTEDPNLAVQKTARELAGASISENTRRAYAGALRRLDRWLAGRRLHDAALAAYLAGLYEAGRSPAVAGMVAAAVRFQMKLAGKPSPVGPASERVLRGFRRKGADRGRGQVAGDSRRVWAMRRPVQRCRRRARTRSTTACGVRRGLCRGREERS